MLPGAWRVPAGAVGVFDRMARAATPSAFTLFCPIQGKTEWN